MRRTSSLFRGLNVPCLSTKEIISSNVRAYRTSTSQYIVPFHNVTCSTNLLKTRTNLLPIHKLVQIRQFASHGGDMKTLADEGRKLLRANDWNGAITSFKDAISLFESKYQHPTTVHSPEAISQNPPYIEIALAYQQIGEWKHSLDYITKGISLLTAAHTVQTEHYLLRVLSTEQLLMNLLQNPSVCDPQEVNDLKMSLKSDCSKLIEREPKNSEWYTIRALYMKDFFKDYKGALHDYETALSINPFELKAHEGLAYVRLYFNEVEKALSHFEEAITLAKPSQKATLFLGRAQAFLQANQPENAMECCDKALGLNPNLWSAYSLKGNILFTNGQLMRSDPKKAEKAMSQLKESLKLFSIALDEMRSNNASNTELARSLLGRGLVQLALGDFEASISDFTEVLNIFPTELVALSNRAAAYEELSRWSDALSDYDQALKIPQDDSALIKLHRSRGTVLMNLKEYDNAIESFTTAIRMNKDEEDSYNLRAKAYLEKGDLKAALADAHDYVKRNNSYRSFINRGLIRYRDDATIEDAIRDFQRALSDNIEETLRIFPEIYQSIAHGLTKIGNWTEAISYYTKAMDIFGDNRKNVDLLLSRASCSFKLGDFTETLADLNRAVETGQKKIESYMARGVFYATYNRRGSAIEDFNKVLELDENHADAKKGRDHMMNLIKMEKEKIEGKKENEEKKE